MPDAASPNAPRPDSGRLVLVRHGETQWARDGRHTGTTDLPLLPAGEAVARAAGQALAGHHFVAEFVSPLLRARRTAELIGLQNLEIDDDLREWDYGGYEGKSTPQIREEVGYDWEIFADGVIPGETPGETVEDVAARASHVLARVHPLLEQGDVILVAHGHLLRILAAAYLRQQPRFAASLQLDAGAVCALDTHHGIPTIASWNTTHLPSV